MNLRKCSRCEAVFEPPEKSRIYYCKDCRNAHQRERTRKFTPEQRAARAARELEWRRKNPDYYREYYARTERKRRDTRYLRDYGIRVDDYDRMYDEQNGTCAICPTTQERYALAVDHDHGSGKLRSLLCTRCNQAVGFLRDSSGLAEKLVVYLKMHGC